MNTMSEMKKWKQVAPLLIPVIVAIVYIGLLLLEEKLFGTRVMIWVWGAALLIFFSSTGYKLLEFNKLMGVSLIYISVLLSTATWHSELADMNVWKFTPRTSDIHSSILIIFALTITPIILFTKKIYKEHILKSAALKVTSTEDGFTARPWAAGKFDVNMEEFNKFAQYMSRKGYFQTTSKSGKTYLLLGMPDMLSLMNTKTLLSNTTYLAFDDNAEVHVNVAESDYRLFKNELTFDAFCNSLVALIMTYFKLYQNDDEAAIKSAMKNRLTSIRMIIAITIFVVVLASAIFSFYIG